MLPDQPAASASDAINQAFYRPRFSLCAFSVDYTGWVIKIKILILSEYVNKTEKIGGT